MAEMSYEQRYYLHQFLHPEKAYPTLDEAALAGILGTPVEIYRQIKADIATAIRSAAEELLADAEFAARVDRLPFKPESTVSADGDSITDDWQSWFEILRSLLALRRPQDKIRLINRSFSGDTTTQVIRSFAAVVAEKPDWIICLVGTNDAMWHGNSAVGLAVSPQETEKNLRLMRDYAARHTSAQWVWITPYAVIPDLITSHWFMGSLQIEIRNEDIDAVVEAVRRQPDPVVDLQKALGLPVNPEYLLDDGVHPSLAGQKAIVRALVEVLT